MIVGLYSSVPRSGKSEVSKLFVLAGYTKLSLASPVKNCLYGLLCDMGLTRDAHEYIWGDRKDDVIPGMGVTGGYLMSSFATNYVREQINKDLWLNILLRHVKSGQKYIVDDMRFPNEYAAFDVRINIIRPGYVDHTRVRNSEGQLDDYPFDYTLVNDGDKATLAENTRVVIKGLEKWKTSLE